MSVRESDVRVRICLCGLLAVLVVPGLAPALENFSNGFESGDLSAWSDAVGERCDFHIGDPCSFATQACFMGEILGPQAVDLCLVPPAVDPFPLPEFADWISAGLAGYDLCGPNSVCLDATPGVFLCRDLCATSEGPFGSTPHPDCRRVDAVCTNAFGNPSYGLCE